MPPNTNPPRRIILGLMTAGPARATGTRVTALDDLNQCLDRFQEKGYREIDTARLYAGGQQEAFTCAARWKARGLSVATKWYPWRAGDHCLQTLREQLDLSLRELGTDCVDIFYLHGPDRSTPFAIKFRALDELYSLGKFKRLGLSNFSAFEVAEIVTLCNDRGWLRPTVYQALYNVITRGIEAELVPCCRRYGVDIVIFNPLAGGFLSGRYKSVDKPVDGRFSDGSGFQGKAYRDRYFRPSMFSALEVLEPVVVQHGLTMAEVALRWCVHHSALRVTNGRYGVITGFSSLAQLQSNLEDLEKGPLPTEVVAALDQAWNMVRADASNYWHGELKYGYDTKEMLFGEAQ